MTGVTRPRVAQGKASIVNVLNTAPGQFDALLVDRTVPTADALAAHDNRTGDRLGDLVEITGGFASHAMERVVLATVDALREGGEDRANALRAAMLSPRSS